MWLASNALATGSVTISSMFERPDFYAGWGTLALINAGLAQGKNRSGLAWFLISLFIGPLATLLLVLVDKLPAAPPGS